MNLPENTPTSRHAIEAEIQRLKDSLVEADRLDLLNAIESIKGNANNLKMSREIVYEALVRVTAAYERKLKSSTGSHDLNGKMSQSRYDKLSDENKAKYDLKKPAHAFKVWGQQ